MDAIPYMLDYQRGAAENTGAAFWPTCDAMRSLGGMEQFVANGWAGKDYTHINYAGGAAWPGRSSMRSTPGRTKPMPPLKPHASAARPSRPYSTVSVC